MPSKIRLKRISDRIRDELAAMLVTEVADPRLGGVQVTDVKVDRELAWADVFVSAVEGQERSKEILDGLHSAVGYLRKALADRVELRAFPRLRFHWDPTPERADNIERLLASLHKEEEARSQQADAAKADAAAASDLSVAENLEMSDDATERAENEADSEDQE